MRYRLGPLALLATLVLAGCAEAEPQAPAPTPINAETVPAPDQPAESGDEAANDPSTSVTSADFAADAAQIVGGFDTAELAGSVIIGTWAGSEAQTGADMIAHNHLGGAIVMGENLPAQPTAEQTRELTDVLAGARTKGQPVSIGIDQEGGPVSRLDTAALPFPPLMSLAAADDTELAKRATEVQARNLTDLGFTIDFAPDSDVTVGPADVTINVRSAGSEPDTTAEVVAAAATGYWVGGVAGSAKHFPGHGRLNVDSHQGLPVSEKSIAELEDSDLVPFKSAVAAGIPMVMMGHIGLPGATDTPATLNPEAYAELREKLDFDGVIVTDALNMAAVPQDLGGEETVRALQAGADLALMPPDAAAAQQAVEAAIEGGTLSADDMRQKAERVVAMQLATTRMQDIARSPGDTGAAGDGADNAAGAGAGAAGAAGPDPAEVLGELADKSVTVLAGECEYSGTEAISIVAGSAAERAALTAAAEETGLEVGQGGTTVSLSATTSAEVAVGTAAPWTMRGSPAQTVVTAYDDNTYALQAVARWLQGGVKATGTLPAAYEGSDAVPTCK